MRFVVASLFCLLVINSASAKKVNVEILYESLCPDSVRFVKNQLYPSWNDVAQHVNINFVPFGKASSINDVDFVCQHGQRECEYNKIQSCALARLPNQNDQVEFVHCYMISINKRRGTGTECFQPVGLDYNDVMNCFRNEEGTKLQLAAETETYKFSPGFIPTIIYDGEFDQNDQDKSLRDFKGTVCSKVPGGC